MTMHHRTATQSEIHHQHGVLVVTFADGLLTYTATNTVGLDVGQGQCFDMHVDGQRPLWDTWQQPVLSVDTQGTMFVHVQTARYDGLRGEMWFCIYTDRPCVADVGHSDQYGCSISDDQYVSHIVTSGCSGTVVCIPCRSI